MPAAFPSWPRVAPSGSPRSPRRFPGADAVTCDVTDEADRERLIDGVIDRHGRLDGLINNAGAGASAPALRTSPETFARVARSEPRRAVRALVPGGAADAGRRRRRRSIVNIASVMGLRSIGQIPDAAYVASKAGIIGLTRELASQWGRYGIRVNAVAPGFFATEMNCGAGRRPRAVSRLPAVADASRTRRSCRRAQRRRAVPARPRQQLRHRNRAQRRRRNGDCLSA